MSAETKAALDEAIAAHISDVSDGGAIVTAYVLHAAYLNSDVDSRGATGYVAEYSDGIQYHVGLGLAHQLADGFADIWDPDDEE